MRCQALTQQLVRRNQAAVLEHRSALILYIARRPSVAYKGNAKVWWEYALSCVREIVHRERVARSTQAVSVRIRDLVEYERLYAGYLVQSLQSVTGAAESGGETEEDRTKREDLEAGLPGVTVMAIRDS
eukprot:1353066-Rhodomonas_salina.3